MAAKKPDIKLQPTRQSQNNGCLANGMRSYNVIMYQRIRTALTKQGHQVNSTHLSPGSITEHYYCPSCHNPLQLRHSHFAGRLFIHDQEHP
ncbi:hypothetical protein OQA87_22500, partial [Yersinia intermedia]|nr:hypothetical protein [Yersinia intermedia]